KSCQDIMSEKTWITHEPITTGDVADYAQVVDQQWYGGRQCGNDQKRTEPSGPPDSIHSERCGDESVRQAIAGDEAENETCGNRACSCSWSREQKQRADHEQFADAVLP